MTSHGRTLQTLWTWIDQRPAVADLPIRTPRRRTDLPRLVRQLGFTRGAEIGVWKGDFTEAFCRSQPKLHMLAVDPWMHYPEWLDGRAKHDLEQIYRDTARKLRPYHCTIVRDFSVNAARQVPDGSLDFVYVDSNHSYASVIEDLTAWTPKVRPGGLMAGHDYKDFSNKPNIHVREAVEQFTSVRGIVPWFVLAGDQTPSFMWVV